MIIFYIHILDLHWPLINNWRYMLMLVIGFQLPKSTYIFNFLYFLIQCLIFYLGMHPVLKWLIRISYQKQKNFSIWKFKFCVKFPKFNQNYLFAIEFSRWQEIPINIKFLFSFARTKCIELKIFRLGKNYINNNVPYSSECIMNVLRKIRRKIQGRTVSDSFRMNSFFK